MAARRLAAVAGAAAGLLPGIALAHSVSAAAGAFWGGALHVVASPEHLLALIGLGLLLGRDGRAVAAEPFLAILPLALAAGVVLAALAPMIQIDRLVLVASLLVVGGLVAAMVPLARPVLGALVVAVGLLHGYANGTALPAGLAVAPFAAAVAVAGLLLALYAAELARRAQRFWARTAVRVAGSWIAATGILVLGMPR